MRDRYQCFADRKEFEQQVQKKQPHKIDIGAVFTFPPKVRVSIIVNFFLSACLEHVVRVRVAHLTTAAYIRIRVYVCVC